ncbi:hypothetical protein CLIM01_03077 [Colletotrichum limetticola]|uniref:Uncharacterized protein n=1 Tax=Colletotrichum limetticola TaxID=1209924 RepID=A0ABQ9Q6X9_9PEZI|nr:hypothetical protein CLIM01_03077 [Colletotrichum limetticola]
MLGSRFQVLALPVASSTAKMQHSGYAQIHPTKPRRRGPR